MPIVSTKPPIAFPLRQGLGQTGRDIFGSSQLLVSCKFAPPPSSSSAEANSWYQLPHPLLLAGNSHLPPQQSHSAPRNPSHSCPHHRHRRWRRPNKLKYLRPETRDFPSKSRAHNLSRRLRLHTGARGKKRHSIQCGPCG